jgi:hypothetical protein
MKNKDIMKLNDYFDKIICINLDKRKDRWGDAQIQFRKAGIEVERYTAIDGNPMGWSHWRDKIEGASIDNIKPRSFWGAAGCIASHTNIWKMAKENNWSNVLIIEDDCDFVDELQQRFADGIIEVPVDWDLLYFGGVHETCGGKFIPETISPNIMKCARLITTTCYAIKNTCYDLAIETVLADEPWFHTAVDGYLAAYIQPKCKPYVFHPPLVWQRGSFSDIQLGDRDYSDMMKNNNIK